MLLYFILSATVIASSSYLLSQFLRGTLNVGDPSQFDQTEARDDGGPPDALKAA